MDERPHTVSQPTQADPTRQNRWIQNSVQGGASFADVGGLWGTVNERVSVALLGGSGRTAMVDMQPLGHELWEQFHERCSALGLSGRYQSITANAMDQLFPQQAGTYDVVHCSGVIYHVPSPVDLLRNLSLIASHYLILNSMVIPESVSCDLGERHTGASAPRLVPIMSNDDRAIFGRHFASLGLSIAHLDGTDVAEWVNPTTMEPDYSPWWWLFSPSSLRSIIHVSGLEIIDEGYTWEHRAYGFYLRRRQRPTKL